MTRRVAPLVAAACVAATAAVLAAGGIEVTPVVTDGRVLASFAAPAAFDDGMRDAARSGLLVTFAFSVELRRPSAVWFDRTLASAEVSSAVRYDNLTGVYQVSKTRDGRVAWSERTPDEARVRTWTTSFDRVPLPTSEALEPNGEYYVRVRLQTSPKLTFSLIPWSGDAAIGRADFTFIR